MKNSSTSIILLIMFFISGLFFPAIAQTDKEILAELVTEEQEAVNALVLYPEDTRLAILNATLYPEALIKMESIQSRTSSDFKTLMQDYPQNTQQMIWDLTRYPDLIPYLLETNNKTKTLTKDDLKDYPEVIHARALQAITDHSPLLESVSELSQAAESAFEILLKNYPQDTRESLQQLIALPEVLTILTDNIRLTILVGDLYKKEPAWLLHKVDSLNLELARQNAKELEDWKENIENNPEAMEELKASSGSFAEEYTYDDQEYYDYNSDDIYYDDEPEKIIVHQHYTYHYPYWLGYPYWYTYPRWRHYPHWYDWGFYYGPHQTVIIIGLPSYHFMHWYFYHPHHHSYWPHMSTQYVNHYYGHRNSRSSVTSSVTNWRNRNKDVVNDDWLKDDGDLPNRFKKYGKFETERVKYNQRNPKKTLTQKEYALSNSKRYPELSNTAKKNKSDQVNLKKPGETIPVKPNRVSPKFKDSKVPQPNTDKVSPKKEKKYTAPIKRQNPKTVPKVNKAKDYHKDTWERSKPKMDKRARSTTPKVYSKPKTKTTIPSRKKSQKRPQKSND